MNRVMMIGLVGRDPEMRHTADGVPVTSFSVATTRRWLDAEGGQHEATDWFNVVAWQRLAELCRTQLHRGMPVYIEGRLETRTWQEPGGEVQYRVEIVAGDMIPLADSGSDYHTTELPYEDYLGD